MRPVRIVHLYPELLNLYGDAGNVLALRKRCEWRGIPVEVVSVNAGTAPDFAQADIVYLGGGTDREQVAALAELRSCRDALAAYVHDGGVMLAVCGGFESLGRTLVLEGATVEGLALADFETVGADTRFIGNAAVESALCAAPVVGFENHAGRVRLGAGAVPFGRTLAGAHGNNGEDGTEGIVFGNAVGTYLHGPLLPKNPQVADWFIARALERRGDSADLSELDDSAETEANRIMCERMGVPCEQSR